jgi:hypothetical protein
MNLGAKIWNSRIVRHASLVFLIQRRMPNQGKTGANQDHVLDWRREKILSIELPFD